MVLNSCINLHENISKGFQVKERTGVYDRNLNLQCLQVCYSNSR